MLPRAMRCLFAQRISWKPLLNMDMLSLYRAGKLALKLSQFGKPSLILEQFSRDRGQIYPAK